MHMSVVIVGLPMKYSAEDMLRPLFLRHTRTLIADATRCRQIVVRCAYGASVFASFGVRLS